MSQHTQSGQAVVKTAPVPSVQDKQRLWLTIGGCGLGILLPHASIGGQFAPLGVSLAVAMPSTQAIPVGICVALGYLMTGDPADAMLYIAAMVLATGIRYIASLFPAARWEWLPPCLAGTATLLAGYLLFPPGALSLTYLIATAANALLAAGFCAACTRVIDTVGRSYATSYDLIAVGILTATVLTAAGAWEYDGIVPARIATLLCVLIVAEAGRPLHSVSFGVLCALLTMLTAPTHAFFAFSLTAVGLLASIYTRIGRVASALTTIAVCAVFHAMSGEGDTLLLGIYEAIVAGLIYGIIPDRWITELRRFLCQQEEQFAATIWQWQWHNRLSLAAHTLTEMAQTVEEVSTRLTGLTGASLGDVYTGLADSVCRHCPKKMVCWHSRYDDTMDTLNHLTATLRANGRVEPHNIGGTLSACPQTEALARHITDGYRAHQLRESAYTRLSELRRGMGGQFTDIGQLFTDWAHTLPCRSAAEAELSLRIQAWCTGYNISAKVFAYRGDNGTVTVQIWTSDTAFTLRDTQVDELSHLCGQAFSPPVVCRTDAVTGITLCPLPQFRLHIGTAKHSYRGQSLCGDAVEQVTDMLGQVTLLLCDGMGCGGRAAVDGTMCATLTARLLSAGFSADSALQLVNTALMVRAGEESLSTLDMLTVDVQTGDIVSRKAGAAPSLLYSHGRISRIEEPSLPVGILKEVAFATYHDRLTDGDIWLMMSDGLLSDGIGWIEERLSALPAAQSPAQWAQQLIDEACERTPAGREDDTTVVVIKMEKMT